MSPRHHRPTPPTTSHTPGMIRHRGVSFPSYGNRSKEAPPKPVNNPYLGPLAATILECTLAERRRARWPKVLTCKATNRPRNYGRGATPQL